MFCKRGPTQSESYLFCAEKCLEGWDLQAYSYLRCSFLFSQAFCIKRRLFYGPSFNVTVAVQVQYLTSPFAPQRETAWPTITAPWGAPVASASPSMGPTWPGTSHWEENLEEFRPACNKG